MSQLSGGRADATASNAERGRNRRRGPRDRQGRSLRDFDLTKRLFKFLCSYLAYSPSFAALPQEVKDYLLRRMSEVLSGQDQSGKFTHLSAADRKAIREILQHTLPDWPSGASGG